MAALPLLRAQSRYLGHMHQTLSLVAYGRTLATQSGSASSRHRSAKKSLFQDDPQQQQQGPTQARPSFVTKPKTPQTQQAEQRIPWPVSNRNAFFASLGEDEAEKQATITSRAPKQSSKEALDAIVHDLNELRAASNPFMTIDVRDQGKEMVMRLNNKPEVSFFRVVVLGDDELGFECPSSPGYLRTYKRNEFGEWNNPADGHNLHGLFVRDLLPHIQGMPRFAMK